MDNKFETLNFDIKDNVSYITLNRPNRLNSFDIKLGQELYYVIKHLKQNKDIKAIILKGKGKGFCAGGDVKEMFESKDKSKFLEDLTKAIHKCVIEIRTMEKPVIAAVNGHAFGAGLSLALACDIIVAVKDAKFGTGFIGIGLAPGCGTQLLTKQIGYQRACEFFLTSKIFTPESALELGIINRVVEADELDRVVEEYASKFRTLAPIAVGKAKMLINKSMENDMITHLDLESKTAAVSAGSEDFEEGVTAFVEKRKPNFKGK